MMENKFINCMFLRCSLASIIVLLVTYNGAATEDPVTYDLRTALGKTIEELREVNARIVDICPPGNLGQILHIYNNSSLPSFNFPTEEDADDIYRNIEENIVQDAQNFNQQGILAKSYQSFVSNFARYNGEKGLKLEGCDKFVSTNSLFCSQHNIEFTSKTFQFMTCFIEAVPEKSSIKIVPHPSVNSSIEYIMFLPKRPIVFVQGKIDFVNLIFDSFMVSHSDLCIQFRGYS